ncbi:MAG TPA: molybdenum cofactor guanylyltransferase [Verrucomicrobiae bacterium]
MDLSAVILAGGESRRMGFDKAWLETGGEALIRRAVRIVRSAGVDEVFVSGRAGGDYSSLGCPVLFDLEPGLGPLSGIERGLHEARNSLLLVLAVDLPGMRTEFLERLTGECDRLTGAVPKLAGRLEPLAAIYPTRCHVIARGLLASMRRAVREFAEACLAERAVRAVTVQPPERSCFQNWNGPADVRRTVQESWPYPQRVD